MVKYKVVEIKELTKEMLEEMLAEAYENGYRDGRGSNQITYRNLSFEQEPYRIALYGEKEVKTDLNDSIANTPNITCTNSTDATNVESISNAVHASTAYQNNTLTGYQPRTSVSKLNIIPPKGTKGEDV